MKLRSQHQHYSNNIRMYIVTMADKQEVVYVQSIVYVTYVPGFENYNAKVYFQLIAILNNISRKMCMYEACSFPLSIIQ